MRTKVKEKKRARCSCGCNADIKKGLSYYRDGRYYKNKNHWLKMKREKTNA